MTSTYRTGKVIAGLTIAAALTATSGQAVADIPLETTPAGTTVASTQLVPAENTSSTPGETINLGSVTIPRTTDLLSSMSAAAVNNPILGALWAPFGSLIVRLICPGPSQCAAH